MQLYHFHIHYFSLGISSRNIFVSIQRLVSHKRISIIIKNALHAPFHQRKLLETSLKLGIIICYELCI